MNCIPRVSRHRAMRLPRRYSGDVSRGVSNTLTEDDWQPTGSKSGQELTGRLERCGRHLPSVLGAVHAQAVPCRAYEYSYEYQDQTRLASTLGKHVF